MQVNLQVSKAVCLYKIACFYYQRKFAGAYNLRTRN